MECFASLAVGGGFSVSGGTALAEKCRRLPKLCSVSRSFLYNHAFIDFQRPRKNYGKPIFKCKKWCKFSHTLPIARAEYHEYNASSHLAPLELQSSAGQYLSDILQNQTDHFHFAAAKQLGELAADREDAITRQELSASDTFSVLHGRIAELKAKECQTAVEEVIYMLIVQKFVKLNIPMVPRLVSCMENGKVDSWLPKDEELESVHSPEMLEMIREHLSRILGRRGKMNIVDNCTITQIDRLTLGRLYAASIVYSYFLRRAYQRYQLEINLETIDVPLIDANELKKHLLDLGKSNFFIGDKHPPSEFADAIPEADPSMSFLVETRTKPRQLRDYILSFDAESLKRCATLRTKESVNMIEKHAEALFGRPVTHIAEDGRVTIVSDDTFRITYSSLRRLLLEAHAFGSFLWDAEGYVDSIYGLSEN
uniref:TSA: Wollemia nobilis Ref_Wollemi_Transcript_28673_1691 transcribed RNA sequence n=1 Tax=Wollemia nobilis TaxID=56998 RepID=A0A0C9QL80_9CONI